ncbi:hypothetical protein PCE1_003781 [Barthelona sp. PCE]
MELKPEHMLLTAIQQHGINNSNGIYYYALIIMTRDRSDSVASTRSRSQSTVAPVSSEKAHPLNSSFTFWHGLTSVSDWELNLDPLGHFDTLEGFGRMYRHLKSPEKLEQTHSIALFRRDIIPTWEDNKSGGQMIFMFGKESTEELKWCYERLLFALIGESFGEPNLQGVMLTLKTKVNYLSLWVDCTHSKVKNRIMRKSCKFLNSSTHPEWRTHNKSIKMLKRRMDFEEKQEESKTEEETTEE